MSVEANKEKCPSAAHPKWKGQPRTSVAFWKNRVERTVGRGGVLNPHLCIRISYKGKRARFNLATANKDQAGAQALKIFRFLQENGWEKTIAEFHIRGGDEKDALEEVPASEPKITTVGDYIASAVKFSSAREQTLRAYTQAFRKMVAEIMEIPGDGKFSKATGDVASPWRSKVDSIALGEITAAKIHEWKQARLKAAGSDALKRKRAATTINSSIRNARALFVKEVVTHTMTELKLPPVLPFADVKLERAAPARYQSKIDADEILKRAGAELATTAPESYKIILLAMVFGLRASETDHLLWSRFDFERRKLHVEDSQFHRLKTETSAGELDFDEKVGRIFRALEKKKRGKFVIESVSDASKSKANSSAYRCQRHFNVAIRWLRQNGVDVLRPTHELRKEVGSMIASSDGIYAASRYLRHSDIQITASIYADKKTAVIPKFRL